MSGAEQGSITVSVDGFRTEPGMWEAVRGLPKQALPELTPAQREVAASLRIPEEDYARSVEARRRTTDELIKKTERFARLLHRTLQARGPDVQLERVSLLTLEHRFEVLVRVRGELETLRVAEDIADGLFEEGSREAEERLSRVLDYGLIPAGHA